MSNEKYSRDGLFRPQYTFLVAGGAVEQWAPYTWRVGTCPVYSWKRCFAYFPNFFCDYFTNYCLLSEFWLLSNSGPEMVWTSQSSFWLFPSTPILHSCHKTTQNPPQKKRYTWANQILSEDKSTKTEIRKKGTIKQPLVTFSIFETWNPYFMIPKI